jgi:diguanylate cyclase
MDDLNVSQNTQFSEFHWLMDMLQTIDVGLVVLDNEGKVVVWNGFMENHSGINPMTIKGKGLYDFFSEIPQDWLSQKIDTVRLLKNQAFITWEQRPYLFRFKHYRPITGLSDYMYQNVCISPLMSSTGDVENVCLVVYDVTDVATQHEALEAANKKLEAFSRTDHLTQLNNRRAWEEAMHSCFDLYRRYQNTCALVMFDIDHFKAVNDTYGHPAGDAVIARTADAIRLCCRTTDVSGRYGGEEFGILLPETDAEGAATLAERLRKHIEDSAVEYDGQTIRYTVSLGVALLNGKYQTAASWLSAADEALYRAKEGGRNQVQVTE